MTDHMHIVAFDIPYPPDYGGVIDIFYKIKALHAAGCKIYLHCFGYGRQHADELEPFCKAVWYYPRVTGLKGVLPSMPYIVSSRKSPFLLQRLAEMDAPILFEGIHTTYYLDHPALKNRFKAIRIHNIEHQYTQQLASKPAPLIKKLYFRWEAPMLKRFEMQLHQADAFFALSATDAAFFKAQYPAALHVHVPPFHSANGVSIVPGRGTYCLYHGNLSHPENIEAVLFLLKEVFPGLGMPLTVAGMKPAQAIRDACAQLDGCTLIADPSQDLMDNLVRDAQVIVLPTFQESGVKLKLLHSLFTGKWMVVTRQMLTGTGLAQDNSLRVADGILAFKNAITHAFERDFTVSDIEAREIMLSGFSNARSAQLLLNNMNG